MKNNTTTTFVAETQIQYKAKNYSNKIYQIWIINSDGGVLIQNQTAQISRHTSAEDLTLCATNLEEAFGKIEKNVGILCTKEYLRDSYEYKENGVRYKGFILTSHLDKDHKDIIEERSNGKFIDYRELMTKLAPRNLTPECKESLLYLISVLYDKYNFM